ncbi:transposase, IS66 family Orf2 [Desulfobacula toluolica Tol2]|uniref:Transposase, IS66 family Orf2 n=1 Tax=Desulfobacula toluolica (strain DSM 7467 / Tol2) TaxID=651182 RepID=K0NGB1_DESTT|nr:transposase, IS66 family Orf2 [Desulfobacula toluolica Tol2]
MIQVTPHMRIFLAVEPVDFRKGIDTLAALCRTTLKCDPFSGCMFVFLNRRRTAIKILCYDGQGILDLSETFVPGAFQMVAEKGLRYDSDP